MEKYRKVIQHVSLHSHMAFFTATEGCFNHCMNSLCSAVVWWDSNTPCHCDAKEQSLHQGAWPARRWSDMGTVGTSKLLKKGFAVIKCFSHASSLGFKKIKMLWQIGDTESTSIALAMWNPFCIRKEYHSPRARPARPVPTGNLDGFFWGATRRTQDEIVTKKDRCNPCITGGYMDIYNLDIGILDMYKSSTCNSYNSYWMGEHSYVIICKCNDV